MNPILKKVIAATGLIRGGRLSEATAAIQRALAAEAAVPRAPSGNAEALEGFVREVEPHAATAVLDAAPATVVERPAREAHSTGRFAESSYTGASGTRSFKLYEPAGFEGRTLPLLVMLHGCTQDPDDFAAGTRMNTLAQERGVFVLYPEQAPRSNAQKCWNWFMPGDQRRGQGEPALLAGMTRHVVATHAIDADRVWVAGLSAGGAMAAILAREYPDLFAAAGVHSGLPPGAAHDVTSAFGAMKAGAGAAQAGWPASFGAALRSPLANWPGVEPTQADAIADAEEAQRSAPLIVFHGDADSTVNPVNGVHVVDAALGDAPWQATKESGSASDGRAFTRTVYRAAEAAPSAPSRAEFWLVHGAAHAWSGGDAAGSYTDSGGPDASREMLRFFAEHPLRDSKMS